MSDHDKRKAARARYAHSEAGKEARRRYRQSEAGKAARRRETQRRTLTLKVRLAGGYCRPEIIPMPTSPSTLHKAACKALDTYLSNPCYSTRNAATAAVAAYRRDEEEPLVHRDWLWTTSSGDLHKFRAATRGGTHAGRSKRCAG